MLAAAALAPAAGARASGTLALVAIALMAAAVLLVAWSRYSLGRSFTPYPRPREAAGHCTHGPYRFVRHPMYAAVILAAAGWALLWQSLLGAALALALAVLLDAKARREERWLEEAYPTYREYRLRVKRLLPGIY